MKTWQEITDYFNTLYRDENWAETAQLMLQVVKRLSNEPDLYLTYRSIALDTQALLLWLPEANSGQVVHILPYEGQLWVFRDNVSPESYYGTAHQVNFDTLIPAVKEQLRATLLKN